MKTTATEYKPVTVETIEQTARAAAWVAIRKAYLATARKVKDANGETLDYDGNSGGADIVRRLYYGFSATQAAAKQTMQDAETAAAKSAANAAKSAADAKTAKADAKTAKEAADVYADTTGNDTDDCINAAALALWENIVENGGTEGTEGAFMEAVRAVHKYIYQQDTNTGVKVRRKYDENGRLLAVNDYRYIKYSHIYIDEYRDTEDGAAFDVVDVNDELSKYIKNQRNNDTINDVLTILTPMQKQIVHYIALGYTYETIARRLNTTAAAVRKHMQRIREKAAAVKTA